MEIDTADLARFFKNVNKTGDCWVWTGCASPPGARSNQHGYGLIRYQGKMWRVHRLSYFWFIHEPKSSPLPSHIHHVCRNTLCVNPDHLQGLTPAEHLIIHAPRSASSVNARKTHCRKGHPFDEANTYSEDGKHRRCRICMRERRILLRQRCQGNKRKSQYRGVYWDAEHSLWKAQIKVKKRAIIVGYFKDEKSAARAWNEQAVATRGEGAFLNQV